MWNKLISTVARVTGTTIKSAVDGFKQGYNNNSTPQPVCGHMDCWDGALGKGKPCTMGHGEGYERYNKEGA